MNDNPLQILNHSAIALSFDRASRARNEEYDMLQRQYAISRLVPQLDAMKKILKGRVAITISVSATRSHLDVYLKRPWSFFGPKAIKFRIYSTDGGNPDCIADLPLLDALTGAIELPKYEAYMVERIGRGQVQIVASAEGVVQYLAAQAAPLLQN